MQDVRAKLHDNVVFSKQEMKQLVTTSAPADSLETMRDLIYLKETFGIQVIMGTLKKKVMDQGKPFFEVWMSEVNDEIQSLAEAFGERYFLQAAWIQYEQA